MDAPGLGEAGLRNAMPDPEFFQESSEVSQDIQQHILALHDKLERLDGGSLEPRTRELLIVLLNDLTRLLGGSSFEDDDQPLTARLEQLAVRFEAEHPAVGTAVRQLIDALAKAGI